MQLTQALLLACSTLAAATPYHHGHRGEWHHSYKSGCAHPSASAGAGGAPIGGAPIYVNSSMAALPYPMQPTATGGASASATGVLPIASSSAPSSALPSESATSVPTSVLGSSSAAPPTQPTSSPAEAPSSTVAAPPVASSSAAPAPVSGGATYTATFTQYGAGDSFGSGNCNTATAACGWYTNPGYNAAASQNLFGVGPGAGAGPGCGLCFALTAKTNPYANNAALTGTQSIVIKVNNLCPADGNPLCSQGSLTDTNSLGGNVNFDLCKDDGAAAALFGSSGVGAALGTATQVSCSEWSGSSNLTS